MRSFKIFGIHDDGRPTERLEVRAASHFEARSLARRMFDTAATVEVWEGSCRIATLHEDRERRSIRLTRS